MKLTVILFLISSTALAGGRHDHEITINNYETNNYYDVTEAVESGGDSPYSNRAIAMALANNTPFDYVTHQLQTSINASRYEGETGLNLGIAKRFKSVEALFYGAYSRSGDQKGVSAGAVFRW